MSALGPDIRAALEATRLADAAPSAIRQRGRQRLISTLAAGAVSTSVALAEGARLVGSGATMTTGTAAGGTLSLASTLVGSSLIGLSLGLAAISPSSKITEDAGAAVAVPSVTPDQSVRRAVVAPQRVTSALSMLRGEERAGPVALAATKHPAESEASTSRAPTALTVPEQKQRDILPRRVPPGTLTPQPEAPLEAAPELTTSSATGAPPSPIKASIARELEIIGEVRRALIHGQAGLAIVALDRHAAEFPNGALAEEATASRVVALCALGRVEEGQRWSAVFRSRYTNSPHLKRLQSACPERAQSQIE